MSRITGRIIVDADACPRQVKDIICTLSEEYGWEMITVASFNHHVTGKQRHIVVGDEPQAADIAVANMTAKGDIIVTQDWGLAALVLGKGAQALTPWGHIFNEEKMAFLLEERYLKEKVRRGGLRTKGPAARSAEDDLRFKKALARLLKGKESNSLEQ